MHSNTHVRANIRERRARKSKHERERRARERKGKEKGNSMEDKAHERAIESTRGTSVTCMQTLNLPVYRSMNAHSSIK